jgi:DNA-binding transcriptional MerR regulator
MSRRYRIGEFARLSGTNIRTLRFYEQERLLLPCDVDPRTRYRYYEAAQLKDLAAIRALKELGATLEDIRRVFARGDRDSARRQLLTRLRSNALRTLAATEQSLAWIEVELEDGGHGSGCAPVTLRRGREVPIASIRANMRSYSDVVSLERELLESLHPGLAGPMRGVLWHRCEASGAIEGEPFVELRPAAAGCAGKSLPIAQVASSFCESDDDAAVRTYDALERWIHRRSLKLAGPKREIYVGPLLEIQFPVRPA